MVFSTPIFLFYFLALTLLVYYLVPRKGRNVVLLISSLFFYYWGEREYVAIMFLSTAIDYTHGMLVERCKNKGNDKGARLAVASSIIFNLALLLFFKYWDFLAGSLQAMGLTFMPVLGIHLPIGISFYTFQTMSYVIDVYRKEVKVQKNFVTFGTYVALFPQLIAGPIIRYQTVEEQMVKRKETIDLFSKGIVRFMIGLGKKVLIANPIGDLFREIAGMGAADLTTVSAWLGVIAFTLQIYFDFSGYSDMAIGLGSMFGFSFPENFKHPYESRSITEFWRRWHISLGTWFKEYVYIPLGGNRKGFGRQILNISIVWLLTGLWHGAYGNFVVWGIYYGILLMIEKLLWKPVFSRLPSFFMHLYTMFFVILGWGIFSWQDMADGTNYFKTLFGISGNFVNREAMYLLSSYLILLVIAIIGSVSLLRTCINRFFLPEKTMRREVCGTLFVVVVFILSVALLVNSSYNPFLYFRF